VHGRLLIAATALTKNCGGSAVVNLHHALENLLHFPLYFLISSPLAGANGTTSVGSRFSGSGHGNVHFFPRPFFL